MISDAEMDSLAMAVIRMLDRLQAAAEPKPKKEKQRAEKISEPSRRSD